MKVTLSFLSSTLIAVGGLALSSVPAQAAVVLTDANEYVAVAPSGETVLLILLALVIGIMLLTAFWLFRRGPGTKSTESVAPTYEVNETETPEPQPIQKAANSSPPKTQLGLTQLQNT